MTTDQTRRRCATKGCRRSVARLPHDVTPYCDTCLQSLLDVAFLSWGRVGT